MMLILLKPILVSIYCFNYYFNALQILSKLDMLCKSGPEYLICRARVIFQFSSYNTLHQRELRVAPISWCAFAKRTYCFNYDFNVLQILNKIRHALQKRARGRAICRARGTLFTWLMAA